jgi:hypothetical protein
MSKRQKKVTPPTVMGSASTSMMGDEGVDEGDGKILVDA